MVKTFLLVAVYNSQTGEVLKILDTLPGFQLLSDCQKAMTMLPPPKGVITYKAWCLTPSDISI